MWIMNIVSDYMDAYENYEKACNMTWKTAQEWERKQEKIKHRGEYYNKQNEALWAIHAVSGISYDVLYNAVRIERKYGKKHKYEKCLFFGDNIWEEEKRERLFKCLMAKSPEDLIGIYNNEFCEKAIRRIENKRYDEYKTKQ